MDIVTSDGHRVKVTAHIDEPCQLDQVKTGRSGIGLLEVGPLTNNVLPISEDTLLGILLKARGAVQGRTVTVLISRGGGLEAAEGLSPGGIRLCLARPDLYRSQLRAILRAGAEGGFELALPSVGQVTEIISFKGLLAGFRSELEREGLPCRLPEIGVMVEIPAVIPTIKTIAYESGFFILGENYLSYLMADQLILAERDNYVPFYSQAFLLQIESLMESLKGRKSVRFSGPFVADPLAGPLLVGMGFDQIVAPPRLIPGIGSVVANVSYLDARLVAAKTASYWKPEQAREYVRERVSKLRYL